MLFSVNFHSIFICQIHALLHLPIKLPEDLSHHHLAILLPVSFFSSPFFSKTVFSLSQDLFLLFFQHHIVLIMQLSYSQSSLYFCSLYISFTHIYFTYSSFFPDIVEFIYFYSVIAPVILVLFNSNYHSDYPFFANESI